ncbi:MAG: Fused sensor histidine kinase protein and response regulator, partial [Planctomycetota bacterium]|nr:Fused sensor histidine kinase protein and response regulator [Planctomycetota bacterium]
ILKKRIVVVIVTFLLFGMLPLVLFRILAFPKASEELKHGVKRNLEGILNTQKDMLTLLRHERESHARAISDAILSTLLIHGDDNFVNLINGKNEHEYLRLKTQLECTKMDYGYRGIFICDGAGIIHIATETEKSMVDTNILKEKAFRNIQEILHDGKTYFSDVIHFSHSGDTQDGKEHEIPSLFLSYPIKGENRDVIGAIVLWMDTSILNQAIQNAAMGKTGEAYLVNKEGIMITKSRFSEHIKNTGDACKTCHVVTDPDNQIITKGVKKCITEKAPGYDLEGYRDYDGLKVLGAWSWLKDFNMGLIVEIDADEALGALDNISSMIKSLMIAMIIPAFTIAVLTYRKLSSGYMLKNLSVPHKALLGITTIITIGFIIAVLDGYELRKERGYLREQKYKVRNPFNTLGSLVTQRDEDFIKSKISNFKKELPVIKSENTIYQGNKESEVAESNAKQSSEKSVMTWELKQ